MPTAADLATLIAFLTPLAWSPGPGNTAFAALGARGWGAVPAALAGYHAATLAVTLGLAAATRTVAATLPQALGPLRLVGTAWVLRLAWGLARTGSGAMGSPARVGFRAGAALLALNPKAWLIMALLVSQFAHWPPVLLSAVFTLNNLVAFLGWAAAGRGLGRVFAQPRAARRLNLGLAALLAGSALLLWR